MRPFAALLIAELTFGAVLMATAGTLPPRVASHFDLAGAPNGWMSREAYLMTMAAVAVLPAVLMAGFAWMLPAVPNSLINLPHRHYWLAAERRRDTVAQLQQRISSIPAMLAFFVVGLHLLVVQANRQAPARLSNLGLGVLAGCLIIGCGAVVVQLLRHFGRPPATGSGSQARPTPQVDADGLAG